LKLFTSKTEPSSSDYMGVGKGGGRNSPYAKRVEKHQRTGAPRKDGNAKKF